MRLKVNPSNNQIKWTPVQVPYKKARAKMMLKWELGFLACITKTDITPVRFQSFQSALYFMNGIAFQGKWTVSSTDTSLQGSVSIDSGSYAHLCLQIRETLLTSSAFQPLLGPPSKVSCSPLANKKCRWPLNPKCISPFVHEKVFSTRVPFSN